MKILLVSIHHPELVRGGAQQVAYELFTGLKERGEDVVLLASVDESMPALFKSGARITGFDGRKDEFLFLCRGYNYWWHKIGIPILAESFAEFLDTVQPDVVHFHHFLTFGIDFLTLTRRTCPQARIVLTLHEFVAICNANGQMVRRTDLSLCDHDSPVRCHQCFPEHSPEQFYMRKSWLLSHLKSVDVFATPTVYMKDFYTRWGLESQTIFHVPNGQNNYAKKQAQPVSRKLTRRNRFGFFGQLVDNKGILVLLDAVAHLWQDGFDDFVVEINGDNLRYASPTNRAKIDALLEAEAALSLKERIVFFNGPYHTDSLATRMDRIDWVVVPSIWWETFALVISESWMFGKPVIASNIGAMSERISEGVGGLLFPPGDARALASTIRRACEEGGLWKQLVSALPDPPSKELMIDGYLDLYARPGLKAETNSIHTISV